MRLATLRAGRHAGLATRRWIVDTPRIVGRLVGMDNTHDTLATIECCDWAWPLSIAERTQALADGMPAYVLEGMYHVCCLEPGHADACTCQCGDSQ